ncbi:MAG: LysM peptidoglycan-binding domain-containing protein [Pseudoxanthomonas sp.]|nr:MAG: LysM peptidoglycan-binding domain-containing protein [Pseudoxanthomonas sp.]
MKWLDANGNELSLDRGSLVNNGAAWVGSSRTVSPPAGAVSLVIGVSARNDGGEGPVLVDHFNVVASGTGSGGSTGGGGTGGGGGTEIPVQQQSQAMVMMGAAALSIEPTGNPQVDNLGALVDLARVSYTGAGAGYDEAGRLQGYRYTLIRHEEGSGANNETPANYTHTYTYQYEGRESYLEKQVYGSSTNPDFKASTSASTYDAWGRRVAIRQNTPGQNDVDDTVRYFSYDGENQILRRRQGTLENGVFTQTTAEAAQTQLYAYVSGQQVGSGKYNGELDVIGRLTAYSTQAGSTQTTVQAGETLRSIAQRVYGNENLWYVLAQANALTGEETLAGGTTLTVPEVKVTANDSNTFKPFNPSEAIGNTAPELPYIPPPPKDSCNPLVAILVIVVAVVVTVFTAGAAAMAMAGTLGSTGLGGIMAAGAAALSGGAIAGGVTLTTLGSAVVGAAAGAAGAAASMAVGSALGQGSFSWRGVAAGAITGGITAGTTSALMGSTSSFATGVGAARELTTAGRVIQGVAGYGASVVGNATAGLDTAFSWNAVAASAVGSFASAKLGGRVGQLEWGGSSGSFMKDAAGYFVNSASHATARRAMGLGSQDWDGMAVDAFGNALGNAAVSRIDEWQFVRRARENWKSLSPEQQQQMLFMSLDNAGKSSHTRIMSDDDLILAQEDINQRRKQGLDVANAQMALDELWTREYLGEGGSVSFGLGEDPEIAVGSLPDDGSIPAFYREEGGALLNTTYYGYPGHGAPAAGSSTRWVNR